MRYGSMELKSMKQMLKDKKGVFGIDSATSFIISIMILILIAVIILVVLATTNTQAVKDATGNKSTYMIGNFTDALMTFFTGVGLWFTMIGLVILVLIVVVVIAVLKRTQSGGSSGSL